ncbi:MAG TPA: sulfite exporter TauE/SafE family protein [Patescibacteria group bacterium]|nr:sulfite exporter TauE/SafE family protein [Patescibacteria group bacterium]
MTRAAIGFVIAVAVGLTGIGSGSFTVPALLLIAGLPATEAVGTAFVFGGALRMLAVPFYLAFRQMHWRYLRLLLLGAVPGLVLGMYMLRLLSAHGENPLVTVLLGVLLAASSSITFIPRAQRRDFVAKNSRWLPWLAFPIGVENGFSSAGAGALGTVLLLNYSEMTPAQVVGTDILFGLVLSAIGSGVNWRLGTISGHVLLQFLAGGVPGVVVGYLLSKGATTRKLKTAVALIALCAGLLLVWTGGRTLVKKHRSHASRFAVLPVVPMSIV